MSMTPGAVTRWLRSHTQAIEGAEGMRLVIRAKDETGSMVNVGLIDVMPDEDGYNFRELGRDLVSRAAEGAPDAERIRLHLHLAVDGNRQEFSSKVFRIRDQAASFGASGTDAAVSRLLGQHAQVMELLIGACSDQFETSVHCQQNSIALCQALVSSQLETGAAEAALLHTDRRSMGDRIADVAEAAVAAHFGVPPSDLAAMRGTVPALEGEVDENAETKPEDELLKQARAWVASMTPAELKRAIMTDPHIAPKVAEAWTTPTEP